MYNRTVVAKGCYVQQNVRSGLWALGRLLLSVDSFMVILLLGQSA